NPSGPNRTTTAQRKFLQEVQSLPVQQRETYLHPERGPLPHPDQGPLTGIEQLWLAGLPSDPSQVPFDDAQTLASIAAKVSKLKSPMDHKVIQRAWAPVKEYHDRAAATVALRNAAQSHAPIPSSTLGALAEAIQAENNQLDPSEALSRANQMIGEISAKRRAARDDALMKAREQMTAIDDAKHARTASMRQAAV
ncbi:MAG: hypothetical protein QOK10_2846, partial [Pseudonocardiales bacterium]|nr:hypothetical protein [Pseudonocardiales bacterium]